jgi:hypothetical protein
MFLKRKEQEDVMIGHKNRRESGDLVAIARNASLYDWLLDIGRARRQPEPLPAQLRADLGLPPMPGERNWPAAR